jgi:hypothetical protein
MFGVVFSFRLKLTMISLVVHWEGDGAIEERTETEIAQRREDVQPGDDSEPEVRFDDVHSESSGDEGSGDEYTGGVKVENGAGKAAKVRNNVFRPDKHHD